MTDQELLELAAKAAQLESPEYAESVGGQWHIYHGKDGCHGAWNPLEDDGDALRLAVQLCMNVEISDSTVFACSVGNFSESAKYDRQAAVRRAITRAAAAISSNGETV